MVFLFQIKSKVWLGSKKLRGKKTTRGFLARAGVRVDHLCCTLRHILEVLRTECCRVVQRRAVLAAQARRRFRPVHVALALRVVNDDEGQGH